MLSIIVCLLLVMWVLGMMPSCTLSGGLHALLMIAVVLVIYRLIVGRRDELD